MEDVGKPSGLVRRNSRWYFRIRVPSDLLEKYSFREKWISLHTGDYAEALKRLDDVSATWRTEFAAKRKNGTEASLALPVLHPISDAAALKLSTELLSAGLKRAELDTDNVHNVNDDQMVHVLSEVDTDIVMLRDPLHPETMRRVQAAANGLLPVTLIRTPTLSEYIRRALLQIELIKKARFLGDYAASVSDSLFLRSAAPIMLEAPTSGVTIEKVADLFWSKSVEVDAPSLKTLAKYKSALALIQTFLGKSRPIASVTNEDCEAFRDLLVGLPSNLTKRFADAPLDFVTSETLRLGLPTMEYHTQLTYLQVLGRLFRWATKAGHIDRNVADELRPRGKKPHRSELRDPFSLEELRRIFSAPLYTGSLDDENRFSKPGPIVHKRSRYWVPLIALFSGMRLGEILQLDIDDVLVSPGGVNFFGLYRDKKQKNDKSRREIPIHPELVSMGFLQFVDGIKTDGGFRLFPEVAAGSDEYLSSTFGKRFATFAKSLDLKSANSLTCFHSFRHNFADGLRHCGAPQEEREMLGGWTRDRQASRSYGFGFDAELLDPWMKKLTYRGLDLSHLHVDH